MFQNMAVEHPFARIVGDESDLDSVVDTKQYCVTKRPIGLRFTVADQHPKGMAMPFMRSMRSFVTPVAPLWAKAEKIEFPATSAKARQTKVSRIGSFFNACSIVFLPDANNFFGFPACSSTEEKRQTTQFDTYLSPPLTGRSSGLLPEPLQQLNTFELPILSRNVKK